MLFLTFWRHILLLAAFSVAITTSALDAFDVWHARNAIPTVHRLNNVAYGGGRFVTVGDQGTILISSNGLDWAASAPFVTNNLNTVVYIDGRFFIGGNGGIIACSLDGNSWTNTSVPVPHDVTAIGFGSPGIAPNGVYVAAFYGPNSPGMLRSLDGQHWNSDTLPDSSILVSSSFTRVSYGNGVFVMSNTGNGTPSMVPPVYSNDGIAWKSVSPPTYNVVTFGNGLFVVPRHIVTTNGLGVVSLVSSNGQTWLPTSSVPGSSGPSSASFVGGRFFTSWSKLPTGNTPIATSVDATNWTVHSVDVNAPVWAFAYGGGQYIAVGDRGLILSSTDATNWTRRSTTGRTLQAVAPVANGFVAVGAAGMVMSSSNGVDWTEFNTTTTNNLRDVVRAADQYVAVGENGTIVSGDHVTNLFVRTSGTTQELSGVTFGGESFVAVGAQETILSSSDAINWMARNVGASNRLRGVGYGGGVFVAVGENGSILSSDDAVTWIPRNSGTNRPLTSIVFAENRFVATASGSAVLVSSNGANWSIFANVVPSSTGVAHGNGYFLASRQLGPVRVLLSRDGEHWESRTNVTGWPRFMSFFDGPPIRDFAYNNGTFLAVGVYGLILQSDPIVRLNISRTEQSQITIVGPINRSYRIESLESPTGLDTWQERVTVSQPPWTWVDESPNASNRLYRAVLVP